MQDREGLKIVQSSRTDKPVVGALKLAVGGRVGEGRFLELAAKTAVACVW